MPYNCQLVLQLTEDCPLTSLDFEDDIAEAIGNRRGDASLPHMVDGNSCGAGTIKFFIHTTDPLAAFALCRPLLESAGLMQYLVAAWCSFSDYDYTVIWPDNYSGRFQP